MVAVHHQKAAMSKWTENSDRGVIVKYSNYAGTIDYIQYITQAASVSLKAHFYFNNHLIS